MPRRRPTIVGAAVLVACLNAAGAAVAADSPTQDPQPQASGAAIQTPVGPPNEQTSWTATVLLPTAGRAAPRANARVKAHLMHFSAYSRGPNTLMVTNATTDAAGRQWVQVQLPTRPNLSTAWLPGSAVRLAQLHTHLRVRLAHRSVDVVQDGVTVSHFRAAVGTGGTPTPVGRLAVQDPVLSSADQRSYLGPYIITLTAYSPVLRTFMGGPGLIAIHGTSAPQLLGQAVSHGCVRVSNSSVAKLWRVVQPGMPVEITRS